MRFDAHVNSVVSSSRYVYSPDFNPVEEAFSKIKGLIVVTFGRR